MKAPQPTMTEEQVRAWESMAKDGTLWKHINYEAIGSKRDKTYDEVLAQRVEELRNGD